MSAASPPSPGATPPSKVIIVGGMSSFVRGTIQTRLRSVGIEIVDHWEKGKDDVVVPSDTAVLCLVDLCSHPTATRAAELAERSGVLFIRGGRKWSFLRGVLAMHGMIHKPSCPPLFPQERTVATEDVAASRLATAPLAVHLSSPSLPVSTPKLSPGSTKPPAVKGPKIVRVNVRRNTIGGMYILEVLFEGTKSRSFSLGRPNTDQVALCRMGVTAALLGKPSASGITMDSILELGKSRAKTREEITVRRDLLVETLVGIGRKERQSENPLLPNGVFPPSRTPGPTAPPPPRAPVETVVRDAVVAPPPRSEPPIMGEPVAHPVEPLRLIEDPPTDAALRVLVGELQALLQRRPDLLEIVIPNQGPPRVRQQVVVEKEWV